MKTIRCSLIQVQKVLNENAVQIAKKFCKENGLGPLIVKELNFKTLQFEFMYECPDDLIMRVLTNLFEGLGGVDVYWDIFDEPITIY